MSAISSATSKVVTIAGEAVSSRFGQYKTAAKAVGLMGATLFSYSGAYCAASFQMAHNRPKDYDTTFKMKWDHAKIGMGAIGFAYDTKELPAFLQTAGRCLDIALRPISALAKRNAENDSYANRHHGYGLCTLSKEKAWRNDSTRTSSESTHTGW